MNRWLRPLAPEFGCAVKLRERLYRRGWITTRRLQRPVISVGNLSVGGTGKTPIVILIAEILLKNGLRPSILTRGYRRQSRGAMVIEPGDDRQVDARQFGDEGALMGRKLPRVPILISANRFHSGIQAEERFGVNVHILDDGFQHWALARDVDLVVIDSTQLPSKDALLPAGRLREPISALRRASGIILTRTELADPRPAEQLAHEANPSSPLFHSTTELTQLIEAASGKSHHPSFFNRKTVFAFCGLGNAGSFFASLRRWNFSLAGEKAFPDHHVYSRFDISEIGRVAAGSGAEACVTTEKDFMNLPPAAGDQSPLPIFYCTIRAQIREETEFEEMLLMAARYGKEQNL